MIPLLARPVLLQATEPLPGPIAGVAPPGELAGLLLLAAGASFLLGLPLTAVARRLATRVGQLDHPGGHKDHARPVPVAGGVAVFWATALPLLGALAAAQLGTAPSWHSRLPELFDTLREQTPGLLALLGGALMLHLVGLVDDRVGLGPLVKLGSQLLAALPLVAWLGVRLLPGWLPTGPSVALTLLWFVVVINAFNFLDGLDGLLGGTAAICAILLAVTAVATHQLSTATLLALLMGALVAFLVFNLPPATIFLGDGGSLVVGYLIAHASVQITYYDRGWRLETPWWAVFTPLVILAIPLYDLTMVVVLRLAQLRNPTLPDRQHFFHRLQSRGMDRRRVLLVIWACTLATGMGGVMLIHLEAWQAVLVAGQTLAVLLVLALLEGPRPAGGREHDAGMAGRAPG